MEKKLEQLKQEVLNQFDNDFLFQTPIIKNPEVCNTRLYKFIKYMPKGADLHTHGGAMIPVSQLIEFLINRNDILFDTNPKHKGYLCLTSKNPNKNYMPLHNAIKLNLTNKNELLDIWTLKGCPDNFNIWEWFQTLFEKHNDINEIGPVAQDYFQYSFEYYCKIGVNHIEMRLFLMGTLDDAQTKLHRVYNAYKNAKKKFPDFTLRIIIVGLKTYELSTDVTQNIFNNTIFMHDKIKDNDKNIIVGIDLVNEEDTSRSISEFIEIIRQTITAAPSLKVCLHAGETKIKNNNEIEIALNLGSKRIGHGLNLYQHKNLTKRLINNDVCLEVCPVSNQILNYCYDLRKHPAKLYFYEGIPIALCSDDSTYQELTTLSDDYFMAVLAWNLNIDEIKKLCENSIKYSFLDSKTKDNKLIKFEKEFKKYCEQA